MRFRSELIDREIIDPHQSYASLDEELGAGRIEINELFVEASVLPMFRILSFEKYALYAVPVEMLELLATNGPDAGDLNDSRFPRQSLERKLLERFSTFDHVNRRIHVSAGVRPHFDRRQSYGVRLVTR